MATLTPFNAPFDADSMFNHVRGGLPTQFDVEFADRALEIYYSTGVNKSHFD